METISKKRLLIVQRVITPYRLELFRQLVDYFDKVGIVTSQGDASGTLKKANTNGTEEGIAIHQMKSIRLGYRGESRSTSLFFYPEVLRIINRYDVLLLEGTTNLLNNVFIIPFGRLLGKKIIWWDAGYSPSKRTKRRKLIDFAVKPFVKMTHCQMAYSTSGGIYMRQHMGADNLFVNLNTIDTSYFENIRDEVSKSIVSYQQQQNRIRLLYVGVVEERKKIRELLEQVVRLNKEENKKKYEVNIVGGGNQLEALKDDFSGEYISFHGPIYNKERLKEFYFSSDLFVLPGDGGLGILQSLLFGLPVICVKGADGTENDYLLKKEHLLENIGDIYTVLKTMENIDRKVYLNYVDRVSSKKWIKRLVDYIP